MQRRALQRAPPSRTCTRRADAKAHGLRRYHAVHHCQGRPPALGGPAETEPNLRICRDKSQIRGRTHLRPAEAPSTQIGRRQDLEMVTPEVLAKSASRNVVALKNGMGHQVDADGKLRRGTWHSWHTAWSYLEQPPSQRPKAPIQLASACVCMAAPATC